MPRHNSKPIDLWEALSEDLLSSKEHRPEGKGWLQIEELAAKRGQAFDEQARATTWRTGQQRR